MQSAYRRSARTMSKCPEAASLTLLVNKTHFSSVPRRAINKVLIVRRTQKFHNLLGVSTAVLECDAIKSLDSGKFQTLMCDKIAKCMDQHYTMADQLYQTLRDNNFDVKIQDDLHIDEKDTQTQDLVIAFGGDFCYLDSASKITNPEFTALMGINSVSEYEQEVMCEQRLEF